MRATSLVMPRDKLELYLHGVGGRTASQVYHMYHMDLLMVEGINPDVILLQRGGGGWSISDLTSASEVFVKVERLVTRRKTPESNIHVASFFV